MYGFVEVVLNIGKTLIPSAGVLGIVHAQYVHVIQLMTLVWSSFWGWKAVDMVSLVSSSDQRLDQNLLRNQRSQFEIIVYGIPKCTHTRLKKSLVVTSALMLFLQAAIITIFEKRSTTTKTQSFPHLVDRRLNI
jgi:hypothetical protein